MLDEARTIALATQPEPASPDDIRTIEQLVRDYRPDNDLAYNMAKTGIFPFPRVGQSFPFVPMGFEDVPPPHPEYPGGFSRVNHPSTWHRVAYDLIHHPDRTSESPEQAVVITDALQQPVLSIGICTTPDGVLQIQTTRASASFLPMAVIPSLDEMRRVLRSETDVPKAPTAQTKRTNGLFSGIRKRLSPSRSDSTSREFSIEQVTAPTYAPARFSAGIALLALSTRGDGLSTQLQNIGTSLRDYVYALGSVNYYAGVNNIDVDTGTRDFVEARNEMIRQMATLSITPDGPRSLGGLGAL